MAKKRIPVEERSWQLKYYYDNRAERLAYGRDYAAKHKEAMAARAGNTGITTRRSSRPIRRSITKSTSRL